MHKNTIGLKQKINSFTELNEKVTFLKNYYKNETCFIISCGPSLKKVFTSKLKKFLSDKLTISIKHSLDLTQSFSDFHLLNFNKIKKYNYKNKNTIDIGINADSRIKNGQVLKNTLNFLVKAKNNLYKNPNYEDWLLEKTLIRPVAGIVVELGIYLPILFGCKKIIILGWDMDINNAVHYYDDENVSKKKYLKHKNVINEYQKMPELSTKLYNWVKNKNIELFLYSPLSKLNIPQIKEKDLFNE